MRIRAMLAGVSMILAVWVVGIGTAQAAAEVDHAVAGLQQRWEAIKYQAPEQEQETAFKALSEQAHAVSGQFRGHAEPLVWEAIILSSYAGAKGGLGALGLVKQARELLLQAEKMDPQALNGSIYTTLGSLYYQVPGWPVGFGDHEKARQYLEQALAMSPDGIDPNYFYGDFLIEEGDYAKAVAVLSHALDAPPRPGREVADSGRRREIEAALAKAKSKE
jgi:tetratricopeptide (TPR) repeat protein